ncbi:chromophore lyase CpcT/CpeT [Thermostichus vulcanus]|uniref:Chromophore lyase CpcT/CpeT n=1 Tax=Thermostichus vulcanus str. 'Rupite' TaxID=2813851 RepID=A0ABT0C9C1_THEVL|nr:chromophore lyase CpcT/CpeT [Thermostichus vulcanus]MCJ2542370.1 chromophore lyase CpcT/CpeT [Thermostichus vulcanus str. 'Rupite']
MSASSHPHFSPELLQMARWLAGDFCNREQAWENPPFFAQIRVAYRPLPTPALSGIGFYVEQAYGGHLEDPYRQAVVELRQTRSGMVIRNYRPLEPERWRGCAREQPDRLRHLQVADITYLPGCDVHVQQQGSRFVGATEPGQKCCVVRKGQTTYLQTRIELSENQLSSHDQGMDPTTHEQVWGALAGAFRFQKITDWQSELPMISGI